MKKGDRERTTVYPDQEAIVFIDDEGRTWVSFIQEQPKNYPFLGETLSESRQDFRVRAGVEVKWFLEYETLS